MDFIPSCVISYLGLLQNALFVLITEVSKNPRSANVNTLFIHNSHDICDVWHDKPCPK